MIFEIKYTHRSKQKPLKTFREKQAAALWPKENRMQIAFDQLVCNAIRTLQSKDNHNPESQSADKTIRDFQHIKKSWLHCIVRGSSYE